MKVEKHILCPKCGERLSFMVKITVRASSQYFGKITKRAFQSRNVSIEGADWDNVYLVCDCGWHSLPRTNETIA